MSEKNLCPTCSNFKPCCAKKIAETVLNLVEDNNIEIKHFLLEVTECESYNKEIQVNGKKLTADQKGKLIHYAKKLLDGYDGNDEFLCKEFWGNLFVQIVTHPEQENVFDELKKKLTEFLNTCK